MIGSTCGMMPKRMRWTALAPVACTPSTCFLSTFSIASANSFERIPMSVVAIASTPAKGPSPTART